MASSKSTVVIAIEAACCSIGAAVTPWMAFLGSSQTMDSRSIALASVASLGAFLAALKAFFSTSYGDRLADDSQPPAQSIPRISASGSIP